MSAYHQNIQDDIFNAIDVEPEEFLHIDDKLEMQHSRFGYIHD